MLQVIISRMGWAVALVVLQVLVFNHVHLFGFATPMPAVYFLLILPAETPRWLYVLAGFVVGLIIDLFTSTVGMMSSTLCLAGLLVPVWLRAFRPNDSEDEGFAPSYRTMEWSGFLKYAFASVLLTCTAFFLVESFTFFNLTILAINIVSSTLVTVAFVAALEAIRVK